jgi:hypothetical protein
LSQIGKPDSNALMAILRVLGRGVLSLCVVVYVVIDELLTGILWPAIAGLSRLRIFKLIGDVIAGLPPYGVLVLLAIPFVIIEPVKVFALYWTATGHFVQGPVLLMLAYVLSILSCDRIYHSGHAKLMQIDWFKRLMVWLVGLRDWALGWVRSTAIWRTVSGAVKAIRKRIVALVRAGMSRSSR